MTDDAEICLSDLTAAGPDPAAIIVIGVTDPTMRVRLIREGFGEVVGECDIAELEARANRLGKWVPRYRRHEALELDLVTRDAVAGTRGITLHPREFGLLWRLMATPGQAVGKVQLLREVWRLHHIPETNSLAVHACRLRGKLASVGLAHLVVTDGDGYRFPAQDEPSAIPLQSPVDNLDAHLRLTCDPPLCETVQARRPA